MNERMKYEMWTENISGKGVKFYVKSKINFKN